MKISFDFDDHASGAVKNAVGHVVFEPSRKHVHADNSLGTVRPFTVKFTKPFVVDLETTTPDWAWKITVTTGGDCWSGYYIVSRDDDYVKLISVDPETLEPDAEPEPAWWAMARSTVASGEVNSNGDLILTRADGEAMNAGHVEGKPGKDSTVPGPPGKDGKDSTVPGPPGKDGKDSTVPGPPGKDGVVDTTGLMRVSVQPTAPVVEVDRLWVDSDNGKMHYAVNRGESPVTNLATNPSFESVTETRITAPVSLEFTTGSLNIRYSSLDTGVAGQNWVDRKSAVAQSILASGVSILGYQESYGGGSSTSQARELLPLMPGWSVSEAYSPNGVLYDATQFDILKSAEAVEVNRVYVSDMRFMTYTVMRHKESGRRFIFASTHLTVDENQNARTESAHIIGRFLEDLRYSFSDRPTVILTGDFNTSAVGEGSPYETLKSYGLGNTFDVATTQINPSYNSYNGFDPTMTERLNGSRIDAVLSTSDVDIPHGGVFVQFASGSTLPLKTPLPSDHNMVLARVSLTRMPGVKLQGAASAPVTVGGGAVVYQSSLWSARGGVSACIDPRASGSSATAMYPAAQTGAMERMSMVPGKIYTISAKIYLPAPQTGTVEGNARRIVVGIMNGAGANVFTHAQSASPPNIAGVHDVSVTFTLPPDARNCFVRLMNGNQTVPVYWDELCIVEGSNTMGYFDGDDAACRWSGTPHASTSIYPGPTWVAAS